MADSTNVKIGVCSVSFDGTDVGHTAGGVEVVYSPEYADIAVDQYGNTPVDKVLIGESFMARVPLAESTLANLKRAIHPGTATPSDASPTKITIGKDAGYKASTFAKRIVLHPIANASSNRVDDVILHKGVIVNEITLGYKVDEQRVINVEILALIDESQSAGAYLGILGDSTA